jgi:hypothetical protein
MQWAMSVAPSIRVGRQSGSTACLGRQADSDLYGPRIASPLEP